MKIFPILCRAVAALFMVKALGFAPLSAAAAGAPAEPGGFVSGFEDLPLMPGLAQTAEPATVFDTPSGRVVEAFADGSVEARAVDAFYAETLPQLGWRRLSARRYAREGEHLDVEVTPGAGDKARTAVRFYLAPD
jgi:hypothetical protein